MENNAKKLSGAAATAQFKLAIIAPAIHGLYPDASRNAYYKRVTQQPLTLPDGSTAQYKPGTLAKWESIYRKGGIDALMPKERSDSGGTRVLPDAAVDELYRLKAEFPRLNATQIHRQLVAGSFIPATVSVCAVQRFWMLVGRGLFYSDNAYNFRKVLKAAVSTYGIPAKLYADNGCSYANEQLSLVCGSIGTVLLHTKIRDGASKGKAERHFCTLKERRLYAPGIESIHSLAQFNGLLAGYIREYNTTYHTGIDGVPFERYRGTCGRTRLPESGEWLDECFLNRVWRRVNRDSTVSIGKVSYDAPIQFISSKVEIRYLPDDMDSAFILYEGVHYPIRRTDRSENCRAKRENQPSIDYARIGGGQ